MSDKNEPVAWIEGPHGAIRRNSTFQILGPQSVSWSFPLYLHPAPSAEPCPHIRSGDDGTHWCALAAEPANHHINNLLIIMQQALDALEDAERYEPVVSIRRAAIDALRAALGEDK